MKLHFCWLLLLVAVIDAVSIEDCHYQRIIQFTARQMSSTESSSRSKNIFKNMFGYGITWHPCFWARLLNKVGYFGGTELFYFYVSVVWEMLRCFSWAEKTVDLSILSRRSGPGINSEPIRQSSTVKVAEKPEKSDQEIKAVLFNVWFCRACFHFLVQANQTKQIQKQHTF